MTAPSSTLDRLAVNQLAEEIAALRSRVDQLDSRGVGLGNSSFVGGSVTQYGFSADGTAIVPGSGFGQAFDGSTGAFSYTMPPLPKPTAPTAQEITGGIVFYWDGLLDPASTYSSDGVATPTIVPLGFSSVEVHVSTDPALSGLMFSTLKGSITSPRGGSVLFPAPPDGVQYYARLVMRGVDGSKSVGSAVAGPFTPKPVHKEDLGFTLSDLGGSTIFFTAAGAPAPTAKAYGDLWLNQTGQKPDGTPIYITERWVPPDPSSSTQAHWQPLADQGGSDALAQAVSANNLALSKATQFRQATQPVWSGAAMSAVWYDTANGNVPKVWDGTGWVINQLSSGSIQPNSLVARDVLATGTVSAALLEGVLVLATQIIAGSLTGTHAALDSTGLHIYRLGSDGVTVSEVIRLGVAGTNDYFSIVDSTGMLVASIDDTGRASLSALSVNADPIFMGRPLSRIIAEDSPGNAGYFEGFTPSFPQYGGNWGPISGRVGIAEVNGYLQAGRRYSITWKLTWLSDNTGDEVRFTMTYTPPTSSGSTSAPAVLGTSTVIESWLQTTPVGGRFLTGSGVTTFIPSVTGQHRFLISIERGASVTTGGLAYIVSSNKVILSIDDTGPAKPVAGALSQGGGSLYQGSAPPPPPTPTQQYYVDLGPSGRASYRGNGSLMTGYGNDVYQGYEASNGDCRGQFWFDLPNITGNVDRVDVYLYFRQWWFNSGGTVIMNISDQRGVGPNPYKFKGDWYTSGWPKPGSQVVTVPSDWWPLFKGTNNNNYNGRATCITLGPSGGTNQTYYGVATDARLRIWYTQ